MNPEVHAYVQTLRDRGVTTEIRLRRHIARRFPELEACEVVAAMSISKPGLWADGFPGMFMGMMTARGEPVFKTTFKKED